MWPKAFGKRKTRGSVPPFVVALITIAIIAAGVLVAWWYLALTRNALNQPVLDVVDAYYVGGKLYVTIRNLGGYNVTVNTFNVRCSGVTNPITMSTGTVKVPAGTTVTFNESASGLYDGASCVAQLNIRNEATGKSQDVNLAFRVMVP